MTDILMPALSPTMEEGVLAKWRIKAGDTVSAGDVVAEIETDKATMEVEAVDEGVVDAILVPEGTEGVKVNTPIARLKAEGGSEPPAAPAPEQPKAAQSKDVIAGASSDDPRAARDQGQEEVRERQADPGAKKPPSPPPSAEGQEQVGAPRSSPSGTNGREAVVGGSGERVFASPLARRLAQQKGVELSALKGSGPHGRIIASDVEQAKPGSAPAVRPAASAAPAPPAPAAEVKSLESLGIAPGSYDLIPLDGMRRTIARRLTESFRDVPHFPLSLDLEIDRLLDARTRINAALDKQGVKISVNDILIKASALALKAVPEANASFTPDGSRCTTTPMSPWRWPSRAG